MKPRRNDPCPCGSGKKHKRCCLGKSNQVASFHSKNAAPSLNESNQLFALFNAGKFAELEIMAQLLTERFPDSGMAWKGLAFALHMQEKDTISAAKTAVNLMPKDADLHNILGVSLKNAGQIEAAITSYRRALKINPGFADAYSNLGAAQNDLDQFASAATNCRRALKITPRFAEAYSNLGIALHGLGKLKDSAVNLHKAVEINPDFANAHFNLGLTLNEMGQFDQAITSLQRALEIKPDFAPAYYTLGNILCDLDNSKEATIAYQNAFDTDPANTGLEAMVYLAVLRYLNSKHLLCSKHLEASRSILVKSGAKWQTAKSYWLYIDSLIQWHQKHQQTSQQKQDIKTLYVVGESHALTAHGVMVRYHGDALCCVAEWIAGCKQWHLGNNKHNKFKHKFEAIMARLPAKSTILLAIGEIDCRHNEGIIKAWGKQSDKTLLEMIQATIEAYLNYIAKLALRHKHQIIVQAVPAPNNDLDELTPTKAEQHVLLIQTFNTTLKHMTKTAGFDFLDLYALTDRGDGIANGDLYIDNCHLLPNTLIQAFENSDQHIL